jgi:hypothetical protein
MMEIIPALDLESISIAEFTLIGSLGLAAREDLGMSLMMPIMLS